MENTVAERAGQGSTGDQIKEQVSHTTQQAVDKTQDLARQAASGAMNRAEDLYDRQRRQAVESVSDISDALRQTSMNLQSKNAAQIGSALDSAAERLDSVASYLERQTLDDLRWDTENFARRNPWLFLGGAVVAGLATARFLKSSAPRPNSVPSTWSTSGYLKPDRYTEPYARPSYETPVAPYGAGSGSAAGYRVNAQGDNGVDASDEVPDDGSSIGAIVETAIHSH